MILEVRAYSRLHFGLMEICPGQPHCYGGVGMMIDTPCMIVQGRLSTVTADQGTNANPTKDRPTQPTLAIDGDPYWIERTERAVSSWLKRTASAKLPLESIKVMLPPQPHIGLGSGTQWACSIAGLLQLAQSIDHLPSKETSVWQTLFPNAAALATQAGRGLRSHIGTEGFRCGGWIVDWGQLDSDTQSSTEGSRSTERTHALAFPSAWRVVTLCDAAYQGESGPAEAQIFERCSHQPNPHRTEMIRLIREEMIPSISAADWPTASRAIGRYGVLAGQIFEPLQGGVYRSQTIAACVAGLQGMGVHGAGQSSWGPTVFALAQDEEQAQWIADRLRSRSTAQADIRISKAAAPASYAVASSS